MPYCPGSAWCLGCLFSRVCGDSSSRILVFWPDLAAASCRRCMGRCVCVWCIGAAAVKQEELCNVTYPPGRCPSTDWHLPGVSRSRPLPPPPLPPKLSRDWTQALPLAARNGPARSCYEATSSQRFTAHGACIPSR